MGVARSAQRGSTELAKFRVGDSVAVKADAVDHHHRTPHFIKGRHGVIRAVSGPFFDPESRAHGGTGEPKRLLYRVEFLQTHIWGARYRENPEDLLLVDVYEQWLEARKRR